MASDFSLVRRLRSVASVYYVAWAENLDPHARRIFVRSMLDQSFEFCFDKLGIDPARVNLEPYRTFREAQSRPPVPPRLMAYYSRLPGRVKPKVPGGALWGALREDLEPLLGPFSRPLGGERTAVTTCGSWAVSTRLDLGGATRQLDYGHSILAWPDGKGPGLWLPTSALQWLGVFPATWLNFFEADELPELGATMQEACRRFLDALPELLDGLEPPERPPEL